MDMGKSVTQPLPAVSSLCNPEWALLSHWACIPFSVNWGAGSPDLSPSSKLLRIPPQRQQFR